MDVKQIDLNLQFTSCEIYCRQLYWEYIVDGLNWSFSSEYFFQKEPITGDKKLKKNVLESGASLFAAVVSVIAV